MLVAIIHEKEDTISVQETIRKVQQAELAMQKPAAVSSNTSTVSGNALFSNRGNSRGRGYRGGYRGRYTGRGNRFNPYNPSARNFTPNLNQGFNGICNFCNTYGHKSSDCPQQSRPFPSQCFSCGENGHGINHCPYQNRSNEQLQRGLAAYRSWLQNTASTSAHQAQALTGNTNLNPKTNEEGSNTGTGL
jgi:hypothetical protein